MELHVDPSILPIIPDRKGSLYLRSSHMKYNSGTLNSNWHVDREAEPKDYDISDAGNQKKDLQRSTYNSIGRLGDKILHETTSTAASKEALDLKKDYEPRAGKKKMIDDDNFEQETVQINDQGGSIATLPRHTPDHGLMHLETTHKRDYLFSYKYDEKMAQRSSDEVDRRFHRKSSQFTDTADYRRKGLHKWQDC